MALYFACDWIIQRIDSGNLLASILEKASECDCELGLSPLSQTDEGFIKATFYLRTHSQDMLDKFVESAGRKIGLIQWYPFAPQAEHLERFGLWNRDNRSAVVEASWLYGKVNDNLRKRLIGG
jgi:hypothetical protein